MKVWNKIKRLAACTCVLVMAAGGLGNAGIGAAYGATSSSVIENVTVTLTTNYGEAANRLLPSAGQIVPWVITSTARLWISGDRAKRCESRSRWKPEGERCSLYL